MTRGVDFSNNASIYDRRHGVAADENGLVQVCRAAHLEPGCSILDIGAGTGRISVPLCDLGFKVVAVEPATGMLEQLRIKAEGRKIEIIPADGSQLPVDGGSFDAVVIARLLYLTPDWKSILSEANRMLKPEGVLLHEWGNGTLGEEWVQIREKARALFEGAGQAAPFHPGARSESEIENYLAEIGLQPISRVGLGTGPLVTLREFVRRIVEGELSYTWDVPDDIKATTLPLLQRWADSHFDLDTRIPVPKNLEWAIYRQHVAQQPVAAVGER